MSMNSDDRLADLNERIGRLEQRIRPDVRRISAPPEPAAPTEPEPVSREQRIRRLTIRLIVGFAFLAYVLWTALNWQKAQPLLPMAILFFLSAGSIVMFGFNVLYIDFTWDSSLWPRERKPPAE
ncbi:hypothetical protein [Brevundimonas faecalis]|uniref:Uncharacterized protein n=1 Tax=Brevundimonas faecalis TaxID=947378 RepID=A0ABV2R8B8_9CAUL